MSKAFQEKTFVFMHRMTMLFIILQTLILLHHVMIEILNGFQVQHSLKMIGGDIRLRMDLLDMLGLLLGLDHGMLKTNFGKQLQKDGSLQ